MTQTRAISFKMVRLREPRVTDVLPSSEEINITKSHECEVTKDGALSLQSKMKSL